VEENKRKCWGPSDKCRYMIFTPEKYHGLDMAERKSGTKGDN